MTLEDIAKFHGCCRQVIDAGIRNPANQNLQYARRYAGEGLRTFDRDQIEAQIPYILSNLGYWRGEEAVSCKETLRSLQNA